MTLNYLKTRRHKQTGAVYGLTAGGSWVQIPARDLEGLWMRPYANEHSCRIKEPSAFQKDTFRRNNKKTKSGKDIGLIFARLKGETTMTLQAIRYPTSSWSAQEARAECGKHGGSFEAASKYLDDLETKDVAFEEDPGFEVKTMGIMVAHKKGIPMGHLEGSYEHKQSVLEEGLAGHMKKHGFNPGESLEDQSNRHIIAGTYNDHVIAASYLNRYSPHAKLVFHKCNYKDGKEGPEYDGKPEPVDIMTTHSGTRDVGELVFKEASQRWDIKKALETDDVARVLLGKLLEGSDLDYPTADLLIKALTEAKARAAEKALLGLLAG